MIADEVRWLGANAEELLAAYDEGKLAQQLRTFEQIEHLWDTVVRPTLKDFRSMQELWEGQEPVPENSVWHAN